MKTTVHIAAQEPIQPLKAVAYPLLLSAGSVHKNFFAIALSEKERAVFWTFGGPTIEKGDWREAGWHEATRPLTVTFEN